MNNQTVNKLTDKERKAAFRRWTFVAGLGWNYETQQAPSVAFAMSKALRTIYPNDEDYIEAMDNHFKYFNITPQMGNLVLGATLAMEEQDGLKAKDAVQNLKISLMGPLSGVGDSLFWVLWPTIIGLLFQHQEPHLCRRQGQTGSVPCYRPYRHCRGDRFCKARNLHRER